MQAEAKEEVEMAMEEMTAKGKGNLLLVEFYSHSNPCTHAYTHTYTRECV